MSVNGAYPGPKISHRVIDMRPRYQTPQERLASALGYEEEASQYAGQTYEEFSSIDASTRMNGELSRLRQNAGESAGGQMGRSDWARLFHGSYGLKRNLYDALGYPYTDELDFLAFRSMYEREGIARTIVDFPAKSTWQSAPNVRDLSRRESEPGETDADADEDDPQTDFERAIERLFNGDTLKRSIIHRLLTADRLQRLGRYSIILLGLSDDQKTEEPVSLSNLARTRADNSHPYARDVDIDLPGDEEEREADDPEGTDSGDLSIEDRLARLKYVAVYDEGHVSFERNRDSTNLKRFRKPKQYTIRPVDPEEDNDGVATTGGGTRDAGTGQSGGRQVTTPGSAGSQSGDTFAAHYSRVVHFAEDTETDDYMSNPVLLSCWNPLEDIQRIRGGSSEMLWQGGFPGIVVQPPQIDTPQGTQFVNFEDDGEELQEQADEWRHGMRRVLFPNGGEVDVLTAQVANPEPHWDIQIQAISGTSRIPKNMLVGNEQGLRGTAEDRKTWEERNAERRNNHGAEGMLRPLIDRLIFYGVLPEPEGGGYEITWDPLYTETQQERATRLYDEARALKAAAEAITIGIPQQVVYDWLEIDPPEGAQPIPRPQEPDQPEQPAQPPTPGGSGGSSQPDTGAAAVATTTNAASNGQTAAQNDALLQELTAAEQNGERTGSQSYAQDQAQGDKIAANGSKGAIQSVELSSSDDTPAQSALIRIDPVTNRVLDTDGPVAPEIWDAYCDLMEPDVTVESRWFGLRRHVDQEELDEVYSAYQENTNMGYQEFVDWSESPCSTKASNSRGPIQRNKRLLNKNKSDWNATDIKYAKQTIQFNSRMRSSDEKPENPREGPTAETDDGREIECPSKWWISLKNWAWDPGKAN